MILPKDAWVFRALHYGGPHVVLWIAVLPDGSLHVFHELHRERGLISALCLEIRALTKQLDVTARYTAAFKPQLLGKTHKRDDGENREDTFRKNGVPIRETIHDPIQGWTRVCELLALKPNGRPYLTMDAQCHYLIRALTNAISDPANTEDILPAVNDQALRALRVGVMSRPSPTPFKMPPLPKNAVGHLLNECRRQATAHGKLAWR